MLHSIITEPNVSPHGRHFTQLHGRQRYAVSLNARYRVLNCDGYADGHGLPCVWSAVNRASLMPAGPLLTFASTTTHPGDLTWPKQNTCRREPPATALSAYTIMALTRLHLLSKFRLDPTQPYDLTCTCCHYLISMSSSTPHTHTATSQGVKAAAGPFRPQSSKSLHTSSYVPLCNF
jgi:hypothetical protein